MNTLQPTILTSTGHYFDFTAPEQSVFGVEEIAHALARICRFTGHVRHFYSVAQHSVLASYLVPDEDALIALHHDDAEAFVGDVSSPLKSLMPNYKAIEARVHAAVMARLGLPHKIPDSVKLADRVMLATEKRDLMPAEGHAWAMLNGVVPMERCIRPWVPEQAERAFLLRHLELTEAIHGGQ